MDSKTQAIVDFALSYPFDIPGKSYVLLPGGQMAAFERSACKDRFPVLAVGSNRSPKQLARKYPNLAEPLPVEHGLLKDHDVVFSAHLTVYGSVPAALASHPGCEVAVSLTWLNAAQLERMHATESMGKNYDFGRLRGVAFKSDHDGAERAEVALYLGRRGLLNCAGRPVSMAAIPAKGRASEGLCQTAALEHVRDRVAPGADLADFIRQTVENDRLREERNQRLGETALPSGHPAFVKETA